MIETLSNEMILCMATTGVSLLAMAGSVMALRGGERPAPETDMDTIIQNAPYHRLHNLVPVKGN